MTKKSSTQAYKKHLNEVLFCYRYYQKEALTKIKKEALTKIKYLSLFVFGCAFVSTTLVLSAKRRRAEIGECDREAYWCTSEGASTDKKQKVFTKGRKAKLFNIKKSKKRH